MQTYQGKTRNWESLKRMAKLYVHGMKNASSFPRQTMRSKSVEEMLETLKVTSYKRLRYGT